MKHILATSLLLMGCGKQVTPPVLPVAAAVLQPPSTYPRQISKGLGEDVLLFDYPAVYSYQITSDVRVVFEAYCLWNKACLDTHNDYLDTTVRVWSGVLIQKDGKSVSFDPDNPADRILQTRLLPAIDSAYKSAKSEDAAYMKHPQKAFIDSDGERWVQQ